MRCELDLDKSLMNVHLGVQKGKLCQICYMFFNCKLNHQNANIGKMKNDVSELFS